jgi:membrane protease YdiL (CAAX protease family)
VVTLSTSARSPLSPTLWPKDAFRWWASLGTAVALVVAMIAPAFAVIAAIALIDPAALRLGRVHPTLTVALEAVQLVSYAGGSALLLLLLPAVALRSLAGLGLRAPRLRDVVWGGGGAIAMFFAAAAVGALQDAVLHVKTDEVQVEYLRNAHGAALAGFVLIACAAAPFTEELIFRGFVFNALRRYLPTAVAVLIAGIVFGAAHYQPGNAGAIAPLAAGGIVLALVYYRSGSLVASMIAHALFNLVTVVAVLVFHQTG